ncbi:PREDICTED: probable glycosyltransferase At5g03795 [Ipomoea nil]|uniref:probable glycosyltransferase At5g03795 n=1 Tax=Ipomoea nil TaxID=35883 RepID=UPI000900D8C2|nr:PREDICTED: probable glycosyltransferase At5g03795 [Ipomoea nil]
MNILECGLTGRRQQESSSMVTQVLIMLNILTPRRDSYSPRAFLFFFLPTTLALLTSLFVLIYISFTSSFFFAPPHHFSHFSNANGPSLQLLSDSPNHSVPESPIADAKERVADDQIIERSIQGALRFFSNSNGSSVNDNEVFYDRDIFMENYKEMNRSLKIYVYPHQQDEPFANVLLPVDFEPGGNYASESYFKKVLMKSHFVTKDPLAADLFFLPFSVARLRHDPRVGVNGIQDFTRSYISNISREYPYWNRSGGSDHFYVACHSIGRSAMEKAAEIRINAIQVVCSSSYYLSAYVPHKDASLPQIWPRQERNLDPTLYKRNKLAFFSGSNNSPVRERLLQCWGNDSQISVHFGRLDRRTYADELLGSKFCLHVKGFEINTARIGDALYYGCVPVIIANHYDLPFADILNWKSFSIVVATLDIPLLKKILVGISDDRYTKLQSNVMKVRKHFQWQIFPVDYDAFYMVMYELWLRRSSVRLQ